MDLGRIHLLHLRLMDDWKVTDDSSINFHDMFFFIFSQIIAKNEAQHTMENNWPTKVRAMRPAINEWRPKNEEKHIIEIYR